MPYPNEHAARVKNPNLFEQDSFRRKNITDGIDAIMGKLKGEDSMTIQAYRFDKTKYTATEAKTWLKDHDIIYISFEEASEKAMKDNLQFKNFKIDRIDDGDKGLVIEGWGAKYGNKDSYGDIMQTGSCARTIKERGERIAFCYQHDIYNPIGKIQLIEDRTEGLFLQVKISEAEEDIKTKIREGILSEMSIGYRTINSTPATVEGEDVNLLHEVMLYEVSLVTIAANPEAVITGMKSEQQKETLTNEIDRIIAIERNPEKQFNLMKLKTMIQTAFTVKEPEPSVPPKDEPPTVSKQEIINLLF